MKKRIVALIDMDCFYVQCHLKDEPQFNGIPSVVVQYQKSRENIYQNQFDANASRGGDGIIAVSYEARAKG